MTLQERLQRQPENCLGPVPKPLVKPKPKSGIEKESEFQHLEEIQTEYEREFGGSK